MLFNSGTVLSCVKDARILLYNLYPCILLLSCSILLLQPIISTLFFSFSENYFAFHFSFQIAFPCIFFIFAYVLFCFNYSSLKNKYLTRKFTESHLSFSDEIEKDAQSHSLSVNTSSTRKRMRGWITFWIEWSSWKISTSPTVLRLSKLSMSFSATRRVAWWRSAPRFHRPGSCNIRLCYLQFQWQ